MTFKKSILARSNDQNLKLYKVKVQNLQDNKRKEIIKKAQRWPDFREERMKVLNKYIFYKKK